METNELFILIAFFGGIGAIFLLILWIFARGAKWNDLKEAFPDRPYAESYYTMKKVVRRVGAMRLAGDGGMKIRFTEVGLRITSTNMFFSPIMVPYSRLKINKLYRLRGIIYIHLVVEHEVKFDIYVTSKVSNLIEKHIGSLDGFEVEEKHMVLDVGIG